jgi:threonine/homoserine/homoserine lactone efflux protein
MEALLAMSLFIFIAGFTPGPNAHSPMTNAASMISNAKSGFNISMAFLLLLSVGMMFL